MSYIGTQHKVAMKNASDVAVTDADDVETFDLSQTRDQEERHAMGDPDVKEIKAGKMNAATGSIQRDYETGNFSALGSTPLAAMQAGTEAWVGHYPEGDAAPVIKANAVKISSWSLKGTINGLLKESFSYKGKTISEA